MDDELGIFNAMTAGADLGVVLYDHNAYHAALNAREDSPEQRRRAAVLGRFSQQFQNEKCWCCRFAAFRGKRKALLGYIGVVDCVGQADSPVLCFAICFGCTVLGAEWINKTLVNEIYESRGRENTVAVLIPTYETRH